MSSKIKIILITGPPGMGKTTMVMKICEELQKSSKEIEGFYTEEVRRNGSGPRIGFDVVSLQGQRGILAREQPPDGLHRPKVGKYSVYVRDFEAIAIPLLTTKSKSILVIDEIGKMELLSEQFETAINKLINERLILATVPWTTGPQMAIVERLKASPHTRVFKLTKSNRNKLQSEIMTNLLSI